MSGEAREQDTPGEWIVPDVSYVDPMRLFCALCGRPIARKYWRVTEGGEDRAYCEIRHAEIDITRRGAAPSSGGDSRG